MKHKHEKIIIKREIDYIKEHAIRRYFAQKRSAESTNKKLSKKDSTKPNSESSSE